MPFRYRGDGLHGGTSPPIGERLLPQERSREPASESAATGSKIAERTRQFILDNPGICLSAALAIGVLIGWLVKRR